MHFSLSAVNQDRALTFFIILIKVLLSLEMASPLSSIHLILSTLQHKSFNLASSRKSPLIVQLTVGSLAKYFHHYSLGQLSQNILFYFLLRWLKSITWSLSSPWPDYKWQRERIFSVLHLSPLQPLSLQECLSVLEKAQDLEWKGLCLKPSSAIYWVFKE